MLPPEFTEILEKYDYEDYSIIIIDIDNSEPNPILNIQVSIDSYNDESNIVSSWKIKTKHYRQSRISLGFATSLAIEDDHPILWQFSDMQSEIYFKGGCSNPDKLFIDLYKIHSRLFNDLIPFKNSIRNVDDFSWILETSSGLLAKGPRKLMTEYSVLLNQFNLNHTVINDRIPTYWDDDTEKNVNESGKAKVLFIDNSFIIADEFNFISVG